jgi:hypothetical protein
MVSPTSPDNISRWEIGDPASLVQMSQTMGDSIQAAFAKRERYFFTWANQSERDAQTGMVAGSMGDQIDIQADYIYTGSAWRIYNLTMQPFTPSFITGMVLGNGTNQGFVTIAAGWAYVYYSFTHGSTSDFASDVFVHPPTLAPVSPTLSALGQIKVGWANYLNVSSPGDDGRFEGTALLYTTVNSTSYPNGAFRWGTMGTDSTAQALEFWSLDSTTPFSTDTGDKMHMAVNYPVKET